MRIAVVGAGNRGSAYARWAADDPQAAVVAVAEPNAARRARFVAEHDIDPALAFADWRDLAAAGRTGEAGKIADAVVIATLDDDHVEPSVAFAEQGYHLLLEKPIARTPDECRLIVAAAEQAGVILAVGHVLRYAPYTTGVKSIIDSGRLGQIVSIQHLEPIGFWHHAHSYVRGNWRDEAASNFALLTKSCHDIDWLQYVMGQSVARVSSFGGLAHFTPEQRPAGATARCVDCPVERTCAYSAPRLYRGLLDGGHHDWPLSAVIDQFTPAALDQALREGPYGECVYAGANDVVDHQVVNLEFANGATGSFTMIAFSEANHRSTRVFGSQGELRCDGETIEIHDFLTRSTERIPVGAFGDHTASGGHGGGDARLVTAFVDAVAAGDPSRILSGGEDSLRSHLTVFAAEHARRTGAVVPVTL
ncbi:Gfo/Idh/MocA family oxidoreductase [Hamadaea sp. NPDC051192]|uniref:Gfo/Idh/MocA family protein n=1 Tax=Hamadaea sp. NPDC051192 TaxID=3154940 RepID=UPI0034321D69